MLLYQTILVQYRFMCPYHCFVLKFVGAITQVPLFNYCTEKVQTNLAKC